MPSQSHNFAKLTIAIWSRSCVKEERPCGVPYNDELLKTKAQSRQTNNNQQTVSLNNFLSSMHSLLAFANYSAGFKRLLPWRGFPVFIKFAFQKRNWKRLPAPTEQKHPLFILKTSYVYYRNCTFNVFLYLLFRSFISLTDKGSVCSNFCLVELVASSIRSSSSESSLFTAS